MSSSVRTKRCRNSLRLSVRGIQRRACLFGLQRCPHKQTKAQVPFVGEALRHSERTVHSGVQSSVGELGMPDQRSCP